MNQYYLPWRAGALYRATHVRDGAQLVELTRVVFKLKLTFAPLDKSMAHSQHLQIQLRHGFLKITHRLMEGGFLPHAEETQGSTRKGGFWLD